MVAYHKTQLVVRGFTLANGINYPKKTFSSVVQLNPVRVLLSLTINQA